MSGLAEIGGGARLAFEDEGEGPPVVLVSGLGGQAAFFAGFAARLRARGFRTLAYDHRGVGGSSPLGTPETSVEAMAGDLEALMEARGLGRAAILGHSTGGAIAQRFALRHPGRVSRLVLSATFARPCAYMRMVFEGRLEILARLGLSAYRRHAALLLNAPAFIAENAALIEADLRRADAAARPGDEAAVAARIRAILAHDALDELTGLDVPTLVFVAADDIVTPAHLSAELAGAIPRAVLKTISYGGHYALRAAPDAFAGAIVPFLLPAEAEDPS